MANLQKLVVVLLVITLLLSVASVAFNIVIFKMKSFEINAPKPQFSTSNSGNIGFFVEASNQGGANG